MVQCVNSKVLVSRSKDQSKVQITVFKVFFKTCAFSALFSSNCSDNKILRWYWTLDNKKIFLSFLIRNIRPGFALRQTMIITFINLRCAGYKTDSICWCFNQSCKKTRYFKTNFESSECFQCYFKFKFRLYLPLYWKRLTFIDMLYCVLCIYKCPFNYLINDVLENCKK